MKPICPYCDEEDFITYAIYKYVESQKKYITNYFECIHCGKIVSARGYNQVHFCNIEKANSKA